jgi:hypothetical protein
MTNGSGGNGDVLTKAELEDIVDQATSILEDAYVPEATREELAAAIGSALDVLAGNAEDEEEEDSDDPTYDRD